MSVTQNSTTFDDKAAAAKKQYGPLDVNALNLPNCITVSRLVLAFVLFGMISYGGLWISSAVVFAVAAATDAVDGYLARRYGMVTTLGRILDPFVDKIIVCGAFIFLLAVNDRAAGILGHWALDDTDHHRSRNVHHRPAKHPRTAGERLFRQHQRQNQDGRAVLRSGSDFAFVEPILSRCGSLVCATCSYGWPSPLHWQAVSSISAALPVFSGPPKRRQRPKRCLAFSDIRFILCRDFADKIDWIDRADSPSANSDEPRQQEQARSHCDRKSLRRL